MKDILLEGGTVGTIEGSVNIGDIVTVKLFDENGNIIEATGTVKEILT